MRLVVQCEREDDGRWIAEVLELPGALAYGQTPEEAQAKVQALEHTAHRGHADAHAQCLGYTSAQLLQSDIGVVVHQSSDQWVGGRIQARPLAASVGFWRQVPSRAMAA